MNAWEWENPVMLHGSAKKELAKSARGIWILVDTYLLPE